VTKPDWRDVMTWIIGLAAVASLRAQDSSRPRAGSLEAVLERLRDRVGVSPIECGRHPLPESPTPPDSYADALTASVRCVVDAAALRRQSWMFVQQRGIDSWVATGLVSGADGVVQQFNYDSDPSGGSGAAATMRMTPCGAPTVSRRNGGIRLECSTPTFKPAP
jgi:hypothetical protein